MTLNGNYVFLQNYFVVEIAGHMKYRRILTESKLTLYLNYNPPSRFIYPFSTCWQFYINLTFFREITFQYVQITSTD